MTVDVYQLFTTNLILDADSFAQVLLTTGVVDPDGCGLGLGLGGPGLGITRLPNEPDGRPGRVDCVDSGFGNAGKRFVEGLDVTAAYELPTERWGKFTFSGGYNHFFSWKAQPGIGSPTTSFLGNYNNGTLPLAPGAIPWNKGFLRGEWEWRHFDFVATGNYIGDFRDDPAFDNVNYNRDEPECAELHHARHAVELRVCEAGCRAAYLCQGCERQQERDADSGGHLVDLAAHALGHDAHSWRERRV